MYRTMYIPTYFDGFNISNIDCIHYQIAIAAGKFNENYYFFYSFLYCFYMNWGKGWLSLNSNPILKVLGIEIKKLVFEDKQELMGQIKACIREGEPIIMINTLNSMYYYRSVYLTGSNILHAIIIFEFDEQKDIIVVKDYCQNDDILGKYLLHNLNLDIVMKSDMLFEIYEITRNERPELNDNFYVLKYTGETSISTIDDFLDYCIVCFDNYLSEKLSNRLVDYIDEFENIYLDERMLREIFYGGLQMFFGVIEKYLNCILDSSYYKFKEEYINDRDLLLTKLILYKKRNKSISNDIKKLMKDNVLENDNKLLRKTSVLLNQYKKVNNQKYNLYDYKSIGIETDSEMSYKDEKISSYNIFNCQSRYWLTDAWISENTADYHWLIYRFKEKINVKKIVIKHDNYRRLRTDSYILQWSKDGENWKDLYTVKDNHDEINVFYINECKTQYLRLYILKPSNEDKIARIYKFEVWI